MRIVKIFTIVAIIFLFQLEAKSQTWQVLYDSVNSYIQIEDYLSALPIAEKALTQAEKVFGKADTNFSKTISQLYNIHFNLQNYDSAMLYAMKDSALKGELYTRNSLEYANSLFNIAAIYVTKKYYSEVEYLIRSGIDIYFEFIKEINYDKSSINHCYTITELLPMLGADAERVDGVFFDELVLKFTLDIIKNKYGENSFCYGWVSRWLGKYYYYNHRYKEAIEVYKKFLDIEIKNNDPYTPLIFLSELYIELGQFKEALRYNELAYKIVNKGYDTEHSNTLRRFGLIYTGLGEFEKAEQYFQNANWIFEQVILTMEGDSTIFMKEGRQAYINYILSLIFFNNGNLLYVTNRHEEAIEKYKKAIEFIVKAYGRNNYFYYRYTFNLAKTYVALNRFEEADSLLHKVIKNDLMRIQYAFSNLSSNERIAFLNELKKDYDFFCNYALSQRYKAIPEIVELLYNYHLTFKGILFYKSKDIHDFTCNSDDEVLNKKFKDLEIKTNLLSKLYNMKTRPNSNIKINIDSLQQNINDIERELSSKCVLISQYNRSKNITWQDIQFSLKDEEAAIEIIRFRKFGKVPNKYNPVVFEPGFTDTVNYAALIIKKGMESPDMVLLENGNELESKYYKEYSYAMNPGDSLINNYSEYKKYLKNLPNMLNELYGQYWNKIQEKITGIKKVYLSVDGVYNKINLNTLLTNKNKSVLDVFDICLVSSTKDLVEIEIRKSMKEKTATLFGNPNFNLSTNKQEILANKYTRNDDKSNISLKLSKDGILWNQLPATESEVGLIENKLKLNGWLVKAFLKDFAIEGAVKTEGNTSVLHIATHGYFDENLNADEYEYSILNNPLLRSGLVMAGANDVIKSFEKNPNPDLHQYPDDGLLTAYEIMNMNLSNTDLVVLSACETGLGEVMNGEGVFGLQRAFLVAGAKNIVMSLWEVDDEATQKLMTLFYNSWLKTGNAHNSLIEAQKEMKKDPKYSHPRFWGEFVVLGKD